MTHLYKFVREKLPDGHAWDFIVRRAYLVIFAGTLFFSDIFFRIIYKNVGHTSVTALKPNLFSLLWCVILASVAYILPGLAGRIYIVAVTAFYNILILIHCGLYSFGARFFSFSDMMFAADGAEFFSATYIKIRIISIIAVALSVTVSVVAALMKTKEPYTARRAVLFLLAFALPFVGIHLLEAEWLGAFVYVSWDSYAQEGDLYQSFTDTPNCMMLTGLYQYTARDIWLSSGIGDIFTDNDEKAQAIADYYDARQTPEANAMTGKLAGKNLILVQLEAIDTWMLTEDAMPNLYALYKGSVVFGEHYAPMYLSGGTFNTEIMANLGLFPPFYGGKTGLYAGNEFPLSLPRLFAGSGYRVRSFHNSRAEVYARGLTHKNWGYERFYSGVDINMPDIDFDSGLISGFDLMTEGDKFFSFIVTYSGHGPYVGSSVSAKYYDKFRARYPDAEEMYVHSLAHAYETDIFIGELVDSLERAGLRDDTVLAFYSDHYNYYSEDTAIVMKYKGVYDKNLMKRVLFFVNSNVLSPMTVGKVTSSIDILPTLVDLFGFDVDTRYYAGDSAFSDGGGYVIFEDRSWYDGERYYIAGSGETDDLAAARSAEIDDRIYYSNQILLTDWFSRREYKDKG